MTRIKLLIVWLWIGIPLAWGVYQSVKKSAPLFGGGAAAVAQPAAK
jgi:hypothetical protein